MSIISILINIVEWFLYNNVTLKTEKLCGKFSFAIIGINYTLKYIKTVIMHCNNISEYYYFTLFLIE